jgi:hypothetical protein
MKGSDYLLIDSGMHTLDLAIKSGSVKVRWNACYAAGNLFRNSALLDGTKWVVSNLDVYICTVCGRGGYALHCIENGTIDYSIAWTCCYNLEFGCA